ncbi:hypothetical protein P692DRAFT_20880765 [Suillus brevipes Sb2]|nr:hypothetical protein P692DRAFT_20880765 [Suillus brevipes Sb2]
MQLDDVISRIRMLPGLSRFLLPQLFPDLQEAARDGPVIIVNASQYGCDALIITSTQDPVHIPLNVTQAEVSELSSEFQSTTERVGSSDHELESNKIMGILRKLWDCVVGPVLQVLTSRNLICHHSRIWWCPTAEFTLLPLYAAGPYKEKSHDGKKSHSLSHFCISSCIPTLAELVRTRQQVSRDAAIQYFVAIGQANPDEAKLLRSVDAESSVVTQRLAHILPFTQLADSDATVHGVVDAFQSKSLAPSGLPNRKQPHIIQSILAVLNGQPRLRFFRVRRVTRDGPRCSIVPVASVGPYRYNYPAVTAGPAM